jgi:adenosine deaminase CECR1
MVGSPSMNLFGWHQLVDWSIEYSCLSKAEKKEGQAILARKWEAYCQWIIDEYGALADCLDVKLEGEL